MCEEQTSADVALVKLSLLHVCESASSGRNRKLSVEYLTFVLGKLAQTPVGLNEWISGLV